MGVSTRKKLAKLVEEYGEALYEDERRCRSLLLDVIKNSRDVAVLSAAVSAGIVNDLKSSNSDMPFEARARVFAKRLHNEYGLSEDFALWSVESWALALGVVTEDDIATKTNRALNTGVRSKKTVVDNSSSVADHPGSSSSSSSSGGRQSGAYQRESYASNRSSASSRGGGSGSSRRKSQSSRRSSASSGEDDCFVATACFGDAGAHEVRLLRAYRDEILVRSRAGRAFISWYYTHGPRLAESIRHRPAVKLVVRNLLIRPCALMVGLFLRIKQNVGA